MKFLYKLKAFTLAEVMITLVVIGVISAVLLPVAVQTKPDENIMKFKKAHNTLYQVIKTLINSDKFYCNGDLGMLPDCISRVDGYNNAGASLPDNGNAEYTYFCQTMADTMSTKTVNCARKGKRQYPTRGEIILLSNENGVPIVYPGEQGQVTQETIRGAKARFDKTCKEAATKTGAEIVTSDNVSFFQGYYIEPFGIRGLKSGVLVRLFAEPNSSDTPAYTDENGFDIAYKVMCFDVDGIPNGGSENCDDKKDICPFGYGIRADGHIMTGARADEWLKKDFQEEKK